MKRIVLFLLLACALFPLGHWSLTPIQAAPVAQSGDGYPLPDGYFFTPTAPDGYGFAVRDDDLSKFWTGFNRLGGLQNVGYPISRRFYYKGFMTQAFQKLVLQWRPEVNQSWPLNVFDELNYEGFDEILYVTRQTPYHFGSIEPPGTPWPQVVASRWALLDANPAIRTRYFSLADPLTAFGLPTSRVEDMGNHYAIRTQRAVFQQWKEAVPWASAGQVTIANGGDIAKELGLFPEYATRPDPDTPQEDYDTQRLIAVPQTNGQTLVARQGKLVGRGLEYRFLISNDGGMSWAPLPIGTPDDCTYDLTLDYNTTDRFYALSCNGVSRWTGSAWETVIAQAGGPARDLAVRYGNPDEIWLLGRLDGAATTSIYRSLDGGGSWSLMRDGGQCGELLLDTTSSQSYALRCGEQAGVSRYTGSGWMELAFPEGNSFMHATLDGRTGDIYTLLMPPNVGPYTLLHSANPDASDPSDVDWTATGEFGPENLSLTFISGHQNDALVFFIAINDGSVSELYRSTDGGETWKYLSTIRP